MIKDYFSVGFKNLRNRKLRAWLTIIGIIISVASIVALISVTSSLQGAITEQFKKMGSNKIFVMVPGGQPGTRDGLSTDDTKTLEKIQDFRYVTEYLFEPAAKIEYGNKAAYSMVTAFSAEDTSIWEEYDLIFSQGGPYRKGQKNAAVVGINTGHDLFDRTLRINTKIKINGRNFEIVGILDKIGNSEDDRAIYIPLETARDVFDKPKDVSFIDLTIKSGKDVETAAKRAERELERKRGNTNFQVLSPTQILKFLTTTLGIVQAILVSVAAISLIVGAIGIMNSMYTSVMERTREIGIMKGIGAQNKNILFFFLVEAGMIGFIGGIFGVIFGMLGSYSVGAMAAAAGFSFLKIRFSIILVIAGLLFAVLVGMVSGALPAIQASRMHVVDALRWIK